MYFKRIYMHGFKSFAEPVTIEFHPGITCIVGPNGSGKSNISDAIRWVLGEQSPKMLRGGKMQEVIFAGTQSRKSRGMAEVILTIDNGAGILPIEYNEVAITRRMYRSGESEYYINDNQCRLRDIRELIMDTGIGVDGYSIIGQGKIADIVSNKTESRREIFEEAAGVVMYRSKKAEAERKLENATGNLDRVNDIIGEIEDRIDGLAEDSRKAEEYLVLRDRFRELEINITIRNVEDTEEKIEELEEEIREIRKAEDEIARKRREVDSDADSMKSRISGLEQIIDESREKILGLTSEIGEVTNRLRVNEERLSSIEDNRRRINEEIKGFEEKFDMENENIRNVEKNRQKTDSRFRKAKEQLDRRTSEFNEKTRLVTDALEGVEKAKSEVFLHHQNASQKRTEASGLESIIDTLERRKSQIEAEKNSEVSGRERDEYAKLINDRDELAASAGRLKEEAEEAKAHYRQLQEEEKRLSKELEELRIEAGRAAARKRTIEEMENNYEGYNQAVRYIMKENIPGVFGTAAELMTVPEGMETAVETALGSGMQNIICRDDRTATKAISLLKSSKAGRLTFIPLSSVRYTKPDIAIKEKGFIGFGDEIVSFDEKYRPAYEFLLSRTAIVDNMDNAVAMSKSIRQGLRFVTLEGEIVSGAGTISGGKYKNRTANLLERRAEIDRLSSELDAGRIKTSEAERKREEVRDSLAISIIEADRKESRIREIEKTLIEKQSEISACENAAASLEERLKKFDAELSDIETQKAQALEMIDALKADAQKESTLAEDAEKNIDTLNAEYEILREELSGVSEEITGARIAVTACESEIAGFDSLRRRIQSEIDEITADIDAREEQLEQLEIQRKNILDDDASAEAVEKMEEEKNTLQETINLAVQERNSLNVKLDDIMQQQKVFDSEVVSLNDRMYSADIKKAKLETQLDSFKEKIWETFEITYLQALEYRTEDFVLSRAVKENREIRQRMAQIGDVNIGAIEEYRKVSERYDFLTEQRADISGSMDDLRGIIDDMDKTIRERFRENFNNVADNFETVFRELFGGGSAQLVLENPDNPLESNIDIVAQPPGKKLQNINLLSGGEKTMTAIAMMFAVLRTKPTPFCILDEVEAALDDANIERFSAYLRNFNEIQFALVTHQKATMEHADVLYGVTMPEQGVSKVLSLRLGDEFKLD